MAQRLDFVLVQPIGRILRSGARDGAIEHGAQRINIRVRSLPPLALILLKRRVALRQHRREVRGF